MFLWHGKSWESKAKGPPANCRVLKGPGVFKGRGVFLGNLKDSVWQDWVTWESKGETVYAGSGWVSWEWLIVHTYLQDGPPVSTVSS